MVFICFLVVNCDEVGFYVVLGIVFLFKWIFEGGVYGVYDVGYFIVEVFEN